LLAHRMSAHAPSVVVHIPRGTSLKGVGKILEQRGVVDQGWMVVWAARLSGLTRVRAGEYRLSASMTLREILRVLTRGRAVEYRVVIPEGLTMHEVVERLARAGVVDKSEALQLCTDQEFIASVGLQGERSLEGYLFPDTYLFPRDLGARRVLGAMVMRFMKLWRELEPKAKRLGMNRHQVVTLASIIEKETARPEERRLISAVFHNRLRRGMPLQADPTVIYGLGGLDHPLTRRELKIDTPYNTYLHRGLPPGPICCPGRDSLEAAVDPADVDYLYFVARGDGTHIFSRTYAGQLRAIRRLKRARAR